MQKKREKMLINILYKNSPKIYTSEDLSSLVNVSPRTIKTDLDRIKITLEDIGVSLHSQRGKGYWVDESDKEKMKKVLDYNMLEGFPLSLDEAELIEILLFRNVFLPVYELSEIFYVSDSTLLRNIDKINQKINIYDVKIVKEYGKGIKLMGKEQNHRFLYSALLKKYNLGKDIDYQSLYVGKVLDTEEINDIHSALIQFQRRHEIGLSDIARIGLIIDVAITLSRIKTNENLTISDKELEKLKSNKEWYYALDLISILNKNFNLQVSESEIGFISIHLLSANLLNKELPNNFYEIQEQINEDLLANILDWIKKVDSQFNTKLQEDANFVGSIALHIEPMIKRIEYGISLPNPWVEEFKNKYRKAYEISVQLSYEIQKTIKRPITENEITYLAMHVGGALERFKETQKIDVVIVCSSGIGTSNFLKARLKRMYPEINIKQTLSSENVEFELIEDYLVISTVPIDKKVNNYIRISPLLTEHDQNKIQEYIERRSGNQIENYLKENLFLNKFSAKSKVDVLKKATDLLVSNGYADSSFFEQLIEREELSSTEIGNLIAIPHSFNNKTGNQSVISIILLDQPIIWDKAPVQLVFVLSISNNDSADIAGFIEKVSEFSDNLEQVKESLKSDSYEEFKNIFIKNY